MYDQTINGIYAVTTRMGTHPKLISLDPSWLLHNAIALVEKKKKSENQTEPVMCKEKRRK